MEKMAERKIRTKKDAGVKVNKALAEKILRDEEKARKKVERRARQKQNKEKENDDMEVDVSVERLEEEESTTTKPSVLSDPRFTKVFEDPAFAIDENSREFALLNPSAVVQRHTSNGHPKTTVEEEDSDSPWSSGNSNESENEDSENDTDASTDSSKENGLYPLILIIYF